MSGQKAIVIAGDDDHQIESGRLRATLGKRRQDVVGQRRGQCVKPKERSTTFPRHWWSYFVAVLVNKAKIIGALRWPNGLPEEAERLFLVVVPEDRSTNRDQRFLYAWALTTVLEQFSLTRHVWHLFFASLAVLFASQPVTVAVLAAASPTPEGLSKQP